MRHPPLPAPPELRRFRRVLFGSEVSPVSPPALWRSPAIPAAWVLPPARPPCLPEAWPSDPAQPRPQPLPLRAARLLPVLPAQTRRPLCSPRSAAAQQPSFLPLLPPPPRGPKSAPSTPATPRHPHPRLRPAPASPPVS